MPINRIYKFRDIDEATLFLNGAVFGKSVRGSVAGSIGISGLIGKTLKFTLPTAAEVTFVLGAGADPYTLTLSDLKTQIEAAVAGTLARSFDGALCIMESVPEKGVTIVASTVAANDSRKLLGFDGDHSTVGKFYTPVAVTPNKVPAWIWADTNNDNTHVVYVWE